MFSLLWRENDWKEKTVLLVMAVTGGQVENNFYFFRLLRILRMGAALSIMAWREYSCSALPLHRIQPSFDLSMSFPSTYVKVAEKISGDVSVSLFIGRVLVVADEHWSQYSPLDFVSIDNVCPHCWQNFMVIKKSRRKAQLRKEIVGPQWTVHAKNSLFIL